MNAAKETMVKQEGACMNRLRSTIGVYGFYELKLQLFSTLSPDEDLHYATETS